MGFSHGNIYAGNTLVPDGRRTVGEGDGRGVGTYPYEEGCFAGANGYSVLKVWTSQAVWEYCVGVDKRCLAVACERIGLRREEW